MEQITSLAQGGVPSTAAMTSPQSMNLECWEEHNVVWNKRVDKRLEERVTEYIHQVQVAKTTLARYFYLIDCAFLELRGVFSREEVLMMLDAAPHEEVDGVEADVFGIIYYAYGEDLIEEGSPPDLLCCKLAELSKLQQYALIEILECAWRDKTGRAMVDAISALSSSDCDKVIM